MLAETGFKGTEGTSTSQLPTRATCQGENQTRAAARGCARSRPGATGGTCWHHSVSSLSAENITLLDLVGVGTSRSQQLLLLPQQLSLAPNNAPPAGTSQNCFRLTDRERATSQRCTIPASPLDSERKPAEPSSSHSLAWGHRPNLLPALPPALTPLLPSRGSSLSHRRVPEEASPLPGRLQTRARGCQSLSGRGSLTH